RARATFGPLLCFRYGARIVFGAFGKVVGGQTFCRWPWILNLRGEIVEQSGDNDSRNAAPGFRERWKCGQVALVWRLHPAGLEFVLPHPIRRIARLVLARSAPREQELAVLLGCTRPTRLCRGGEMGGLAPETQQGVTRSLQPRHTGRL